MRPDPSLRLALAIVSIGARLVGAAERESWRREWTAELVSWWNRAAVRPGARRVLLRRACLSWADAVVVRRQAGRESSRGVEGRSSVRGGERTAKRGVPLQGASQDLASALRSLRHQPALSAVVLLTLGLGIGANSAIFTLLHGIVLSPLPYPDSERIVQVWPARDSGMSKRLLMRLQEETDSYESLAAWSEGAFKIRYDDHAEMAFGPMVSAEYFRVLGATPVHGRLFEAGDDLPGERRLVLSYDFWQRRYGGDPAVLGRRLELTDDVYTIVGVAEQGLDLLQLPFDVAATHVVDAAQEDWSANYLDVIGRLKPGVTVSEADAELRTLARRWAREAGHSREWAESASVVTLHEFLVGDVRPTLLLLFGAVGFVLLIVVANLGNLLLSRALSREREMAVRSALGATRGRIVRQLATETTLLALLGGAAGVALAELGLRAAKSLLPSEIPRLQEIHLSPSVLGFALVLTLLTGVVLGLVPASSSSRLELRAGLGGSGRQAVASPSRHKVRGALVIVEVTLALVLLAGAGLLAKSFRNVVRQEPGFDPAGLLCFNVLPGRSDWASPRELEPYFADLRERLESVAGVEGVAVVHAVPVVNGGWVMNTFPADDPPAEGEELRLARWRPIDPEYFRVAGISLLEGRVFRETDSLDSEPVVILNRSASRLYFGDRSPLGASMRITFEGEQTLRVVGVVDDVRILGLRESAPPTAYRPFPQSNPTLHRIRFYQRSVVLRSSLPPERLDRGLRQAVAMVDPFANVLHLQSMEQVLSTSLARSRVILLLLGLFAVVALLLGAVGVYGVMGYAVGERRGEIGIRLALGASSRSVLGDVLASGLRLVSIGLVLGLLFALLVTRFLAGELYQVSPTDPLSLAVAVVVLVAAALVAIYVPARRASRLDPLEILRTE